MKGELIRAFFAITIPDKLICKINDCILPLKNNLPFQIKWAPSNQMHITLKFMKQLSRSHLPEIQSILKQKSIGKHEIQIAFDHLGTYPAGRQPRIIWLGVRNQTPLIHLAKQINIMMSQLGYRREIRPFSPHLTLARLNRSVTKKDGAKIKEILLEFEMKQSLVFTAKAYSLIHSKLTPQGPIYTPLLDFKL